MAGDGRRAFDREHRFKHRALMTWSHVLDCEIGRFRLAIARERARREGDVTGLAELDQLVAGLKDEGRSARRRLRSGGEPGRPWIS